MANLTKLFKWTYDGYGQMVKRYPKAAKKKRIQKKWTKRFGVGLSHLVTYSNPLLSMIKKDDLYYQPVILGIEHGVTFKD